MADTVVVGAEDDTDEDWVRLLGNLCSFQEKHNPLNQLEVTGTSVDEEGNDEEDMAVDESEEGLVKDNKD